MTDLKELLDDAAGPEPVVTDADLAADLSRGQRALKRRRSIGILTGSVATAAAVAAGWALGPAATSPDRGAVAPAATTRSAESVESVAPTRLYTIRSATAGWTVLVVSGEQPGYDLNDVPALQLVANPTPYPGPYTCDLIPKGWAVRSLEGRPVLYDRATAHPGKDDEPGWVIALWERDRPERGFQIRIDVSDTNPLKWDQLTAQRFAGSCHAK
jgi:hypothetical protein